MRGFSADLASDSCDGVDDSLYGPLYHRLLLPYDGDAVRIFDAYIDALIDTVFGGLEQKRVGS